MDRRNFVKLAGLTAGTLMVGGDTLGKVISGAFTEGKRPNILLIISDELAADAMSWKIGNKYLNTPTLDSIASSAVIFSNAYSPNPLCVPCRSSLFTGHYPHQTKVQTNADINNSLSGKMKNMGAILKDSGYDTGYVGKWHMAFPQKDSSVHGFDFMRSIKNVGCDDEIPAGTEEFLKVKRDKPFFLVNSFINPHNIAEWARGEKLPDGEVGVPPALEQLPPAVKNLNPMLDEPDIIPLMKISAQKNKLFPVGNFDEKKWREYRWAYYRMIEKVDANIGKVIKSLKDSGQYENTVIVFMSDHGDMQGAHGWSQKTVLFDESTRVPLMIKVPGKSKQEIIPTLVNTGVDILPTLCDYAQISLPVTYPGISLKSSKARSKREFIVVENKMIQGDPIDGQKPEPSGRMVRSKKYKYCLYDMGIKNESLIDIENDPEEMTNLAGNKKFEKILKQHRNYLIEWSKKNDDSFYENNLHTN